jgi:hypothetical protein
MNMFAFLDMSDTYEERIVARYEGEDCFISTARVTDAEHAYETAVSHKAFNDGRWIVVAVWTDEEAATVGHEEWVRKMTRDALPLQLHDVSTATVYTFGDAVLGDDWRIHKRENDDA